MTMHTPLIRKAAAFAAKAHAGQTRKFTGEPYFVHVEAVACAVAVAGGSEAAIAAAYLHDTVEDTPTTYPELVAAFGPEVANLVLELTHVHTKEAFPQLNRAARKVLETKRLAAVSPTAKLIKRSDIADNAKTIGLFGRKFANMWRAEATALLAVL